MSRLLDRDALGAGLHPVLRIGSGGALRPGDSWGGLGEREKVRVVLLAVKAAHVLGVRDHDGATAKEVTETTGGRGGTVRPALRALLTDGYAHQDDRERYFVPPMNVPRALKLLEVRAPKK